MCQPYLQTLNKALDFNLSGFDSPPLGACPDMRVRSDHVGTEDMVDSLILRPLAAESFIER